MPIKARRLEKSLIKKGFFPGNGGIHKVFVYAPEGKVTDIKINMSHDGKEIRDTLISFMYKELKLENKGMLEDLANCPLSKEKLYQYYKMNSLI